MQTMDEAIGIDMRVEVNPKQNGSPQNADLEEDLDALVDPETQRIMDEADLVDYVSLSLSALQAQGIMSLAINSRAYCRARTRRRKKRTMKILMKTTPTKKKSTAARTIRIMRAAQSERMRLDWRYQQVQKLQTYREGSMPSISQAQSFNRILMTAQMPWMVSAPSARSKVIEVPGSPGA